LLVGVHDPTSKSKITWPGSPARPMRAEDSVTGPNGSRHLRG
jgi:hypothetical protein